jgi:hypothetical protein
MQLLKCTQVALLLSSTIFAATTAPLVKLADERVNVELNRVQVFSGPVRDFSSAYLAAAALLSLSLGTAGFSLAAWRQTGTHLKQTKQNVAELETLVSQREQQLQQVQLSSGRLQQSGLDHFLDDELQLPAAVSPAALGQRFQAQSPPVHSSVVSQVVLPPVEQAATSTAWPMTARSMPSHAHPAPAAPSPAQLSAAQMAQLQAVQAQLDQLQQSYAQLGGAVKVTTATHRPQQLVPIERPAGFLVINPYQVQSPPQNNIRQMQPRRLA